MINEEHVPLKDRRTHGAKQDWPFPDEIPRLAFFIDIGGFTHESAGDAWARMKIILADLGYLPQSRERASERAMRLSADNERNKSTWQL